MFRLVLNIMGLLWLLLLFPALAHSHGVEGVVAPGGLVATANYQGGEPMSYAKVTVTPPESEKPFQVGRSDKNGRFAFAPDKPGKWHLVFNDEMGHRLDLEVQVDEKGLIGQQTPSSSGSTNLGTKAFFGVGLFMFIASVFLWWQAKKLALNRRLS